MVNIMGGLGNGIGTAVAGYSTSHGLRYAVSYFVQAGTLGAAWLLLVFGASQANCELRHEYSADNGKSQDKPEPIAGQLKEILTSPLYCWTGVAIVFGHYVIIGIQFIWVRLFIGAWGLPKDFVVSAFLIVCGLGGWLGLVVGPKAIDGIGGYNDEKGRSKSMGLITGMVLGALGSAMVGSTAVMLQMERLSDGSAILGDTADPVLYFMWASVFVTFACLNGTFAGLTGINVGSLSIRIRSFGSGFTVCLQYLGCFLGPFLPAMVMESLGAEGDSASGVVLCRGVLFVEFGVVVTLVAAVLSWRVLRPQARRESKAQQQVELKSV